MLFLKEMYDLADIIPYFVLHKLRFKKIVEFKYNGLSLKHSLPYFCKRVLMNNIPEQMKYAKSHEWSKLEDDNIVRVGITDFAQEQLGDLVYIELPEIGRQLTAGEQCAVVESVKTASDLFSPVTGTVTAINETLEDSPEQVNDEPYETWLFCIKTDKPEQLDSLMDANAYQQMIAE